MYIRDEQVYGVKMYKHKYNEMHNFCTILEKPFI